jgi:cytochrome c5
MPAKSGLLYFMYSSKYSQNTLKRHCYVKALAPAFVIGLTMAFIALFLVAITVNADHNSHQSIAKRIAKVGGLCIAGQSCEMFAPEVAAVSGMRSGTDIYTAACSACHSSGAAGAPKIGDTAAWNPRIAKGMDTLLTNSINGINAMPARGLCMDCTDAEIKAAIEYMIDQVN